MGIANEMGIAKGTSIAKGTGGGKGMGMGGAKDTTMTEPKLSHAFLVSRYTANTIAFPH